MTGFSYNDLCAFVDDTDNWGVVFATPSDYDALGDLVPPDPSGWLVDLHPSISTRQRQEFVDNGAYIPPRGTVVVLLFNADPYILVPEALLRVVSRRFFIGEAVVLKSHAEQSGLVVSTKTACRLKTVSTVKHRAHAQHLLCHSQGTTQVSARAIDVTDRGSVVSDVDLCDLEAQFSMHLGDAVLFNGWAGVVLDVDFERTIRLFNNSVVVVSPETELFYTGSPHNIDIYEPGALVDAKKADLRLGRWIFGQYDANLVPTGVVIKTRAVRAKIDWQAHRTDGIDGKPNTNMVSPPDFLGTDELESPSFCHYSLEKCLGNEDGLDGFPSPPSAPFLRLADPESVRAKYSQRPDAVKLFQHGRQDNLGYDMNVFQLIGSTSMVEVQWQDSSVTTHPSTDLIKFESTESNEVYPGTLVCTLELKTLDENPTAGYADAPKKVGVAQSCDATNCLAKVRWFKEPKIYFDKDRRYEALDNYTCGELLDEIEDVSTYDITIPSGPDFVQLDFVRIKSLAKNVSGDRDRDWIGHIVKVHRDATCTVRLGAVAHPRNIRVHLDDLEVSLDAEVASPDQFASEDQHMDDADDSSTISDVDMGDVDDFGRILMGDRQETIDYIIDGDNTTTQLPADIEDGSAWSTDSEGTMDRDATSLDGAAPLGIHLEKDSRPDQYLLLEGSAPAYHKYMSEAGKASGSNLRHIMKEHAILGEESTVPPGIYVRSWEGSCNLLRAAILGPTQTPYAHCPFVFDILLPAAYPSKPPAVFFYHWRSPQDATKRRINPNLYEDGTVCLSLLNTWPGAATEGWMPGKSTLLQALISIQSLILVPEPYYNEPGFEARREVPGTIPSSVAYNEQTLLQARSFLNHALMVRRDPQLESPGVRGLEEALEQIYLAPSGPRNLQRLIEEDRALIERSRAADPQSLASRDGVNLISVGACIRLDKVLTELESFEMA
ncbi:hypothetical protein ANO11243_080090 [Dothideomycetidae sp. 11243]|nr:hypothetical protein ANO11243_080090 [fungal sp. No.11243]